MEGSDCESPDTRCYYCDTATYDETVETTKALKTFCSYDDLVWVQQYQNDLEICTG